MGLSRRARRTSYGNPERGSELVARRGFKGDSRPRWSSRLEVRWWFFMVPRRGCAGRFPPGASAVELSGTGAPKTGIFRWRRRSSRGCSVVVHETFVGGTDGAPQTWVVGTIGLTGFLENAVGSMGFRTFVRQMIGSVSRASLGIRRGFVVFGGGKGGGNLFLEGVRTGASWLSEHSCWIATEGPEDLFQGRFPSVMWVRRRT